MVNYKKMAVAVLLSCVAFSFQVQALSRCFERIARRSLKHIPYGGALSYYLACKNPSQEKLERVEASVRHVGPVFPCLYNIDRSSAQEACQIWDLLKERCNNDLAGIIIDYLAPEALRTITIHKDRILGPLKKCCFYLYPDIKEALKREPTLPTPLIGLFKPFAIGLPGMCIALRFPEQFKTRYPTLDPAKYLCTCCPLISHLRTQDNSVLTNDIRMCATCQRIDVLISEQNKPAILARKWVGFAVGSHALKDGVFLHNIEIIGWDEQSGGGTGVTIQIYKDEVDAKNWVALCSAACKKNVAMLPEVTSSSSKP